MRALFIVVLAVILVACATPYQRQSSNGGFTETQLAENIFQITFKGNGYTERDTVTDYALLRSAELTIENGFSYFLLTNSQQYLNQESYTTPTNTYTTATVYGNSIHGSTITSGGQTFMISKHSVTNTIYCFKEKPDNFAYDARFIIRSLRQKYGIE
jgi:hypothetical protein